MRKLSYLIVLIVILGLIISGCIFPVVPPSGKDESIDIVKDAVFFEIDLIAGQHTVAGFITVSNDDKNLFIAYETVDNWLISETHLYVGTTIPTNSAPGKFPYKHEELGGVTTDMYEIPLGDLGVGPCDIVYIAVHAKLIDGTIEETGWAEGEEIIPDKNWAMYFEYRLSCMEEIATQILEIQNLGRQYFEQLESQGDPNALQKTIDYLKTQPNVDNAGVGEDGVSIWVEYKSGVEGIILTEPFKSLGNLPVSKSYRSNMPKKSADKNAIILLPLDFIPGYEDKSVDEISSYLQQSGYSIPDIYRGEEVTVDLMETLYNYDFIYMLTHGNVKSVGLIGVSTGQKATPLSIHALWDSLTGVSKEIFLITGHEFPWVYFALYPRFFTHYTYPGSFVYMNACFSLKNVSLAYTFLNNGASVYLGWDNTSFVELGNLHNPEFFQELAKPNNTLQQAYDATLALHYPAIVYKDTDNDGEYHVKWQDGETSSELEDNIVDYALELNFKGNAQFILNPLIISSIEVLPETMTLVEGDSQSIDSIIAYYENGSTANISLDACTYDSSDPEVATVDSGVIAAVAPGITTITVSYTEGDITKNDTLKVTVTPTTPNVYTITASAGLNGSIDPSGNVTVNEGSDKSFTIAPDIGYQIDDVLVDGSSVGAVSSYTFTNVTEDHTISATFSLSTATGPVHNVSKDTYYDTIQAALDDADNDNTIEVADGSYDESITFPSGKKLILQSLNGASSTTIRGNDGLRTVTLYGSLEDTTLEGFAITHENGKSGGGIYIESGYLGINNCIISDNCADYGGGILNYKNCSLIITGSTISHNLAYHSGAGIRNHGTLTITGSTISNNTAYSSSGSIIDYGSGGGIDNAGLLTITESTISNNYAANYGGGIKNDSGSLTITESTISGNLGLHHGGGIYNYSTLTIIKSIISGNSAINHHGGGICNDGTLIIIGSTISDNYAGAGGGIENWSNLDITGGVISGNWADFGGGIYNNNTLTITGSIISGNDATYHGGGIDNYNGSLIITESTISGNHADTSGGIGNYYGNLTITGTNISDNSADDFGGGIYIYSVTSVAINIGGSSDADKNIICGNYKTGEDPSLGQQIRDDFGSLYETYKDTNYISAYCGVPSGSVHNLTKDTYYDTIQAALDDADSGNTIEVADGIYTENVTIIKDYLTLRSKNGAEKTTIEAADGNNDTLLVRADYTYINGFTIEGAGTAGYYKDRRGGIHFIPGVEYCTISNNIISNNSQGIFVFTSNNNIISNNIISNNSIRGVLLEDADYNTILNNIIDSNGASGIDVHPYYGLTGTYYSNSNTIINNTISNNGAGIRISGGSGNLAYLNNLIDNNTNGSSSSLVTNPWNSPEEITYSYSGTTYTNYLGNYWDDYTGEDADNDGIGDIPYILDEEQDNYPLVEPFENY